MQQHGKDSFYVGMWLIQPQLNRMTAASKTVQVEPKIMQVLLCLVDQPGTVIRRDVLLNTVWAGTVVGEEVLSRCISELRKAFEDDALDPVHAGNWAVTLSGLYFANRKKSGATIDFFDIATKQITQVAKPLKSPVWGDHGLAVAPDGEILYAQIDHSHHDIMVMDYIR